MILRDANVCLPRNNQPVLMAWKKEKAIMQVKYFAGKDSMLSGFCTFVPKHGHYVGKIGVSHWIPLSEALPARGNCYV